MAEYFNVTTNVGDAEIANAIATNTKLNITHIAFGDGNGAVPTPNKARTTLIREVHRQAITKYERHATNANWLVIETIIPSTIGGFTIREMGIIANGKLISHGSHAPFEKVADPSGVSEYRLKFTQNITDGSVVEVTLDESLIYASQAWVEENFIKRNEIVDNLITNDSTKAVSAKQAKQLQENKLDKDATAVTAEKLAVGRTISFSGAATGSFNFDGSANSSAILTLANSGVAASTYGSTLKIPILTVNAKGLITGVSEQTIPAASETQAGVVKLVNDLVTGGADKGLTAEQGKLFFEMFSGGANYFKIPNPSSPNKPWIVQFGNYRSTVSESLSSVVFPITFPNSVRNISLTQENSAGSGTDAVWNIIVKRDTVINTGFSASHGTQVKEANFYWFAIGD